MAAPALTGLDQIADALEIAAAVIDGSDEGDDGPVCRTCGDEYPEFGDGWEGECPSCADRTHLAEYGDDDPEDGD
ncbi:hypothetical protein ABT300_18855 [Streptomyces sp. NPDC001027]|uniref:hypothetical protein n=1 Tax=Streptomyces sp. NPDC001027 TaxID=3154771 RepID=UPI00331E5071